MLLTKVKVLAWGHIFCACCRKAKINNSLMWVNLFQSLWDVLHYSSHISQLPCCDDGAGQSKPIRQCLIKEGWHALDMDWSELFPNACPLALLLEIRNATGLKTCWRCLLSFKWVMELCISYKNYHLPFFQLKSMRCDRKFTYRKNTPCTICVSDSWKVRCPRGWTKNDKPEQCR